MINTRFQNGIPIVHWEKLASNSIAIWNAAVFSTISKSEQIITYNILS